MMRSLKRAPRSEMRPAEMKRSWRAQAMCLVFSAFEGAAGVV